MGRAFGLLALLVPVAVGGYLLVTQLRSNGPTSPMVTHSEILGQSNVAATNMEAADTVLQGWFAQNNTYAGATLPLGSGVVLVRADATSYCLQTSTSPAYHEDGPGGQAQPGPCS
jgi:hypothetical protein